jgi:hypothetical protein
MEPTEVMMLGKLGAAPQSRVWGGVTPAAFGRDPQWRTNFMNPPPTTPQFPQNLMRQTVMNGLGGGEVVNLGQTYFDNGALLFWRLASTAATAALVYHGVRRNPKRQFVGGLLWFLGGAFWPIMLPVAFAQGFGTKRRAR